MASETLEKLSHLLKKGSQISAPARRGGGPQLEGILPGSWENARGGPVFVARQVFASDYRHGQQPIAWQTLPPSLAAWAQEPALQALNAAQFAFLDTETSGLSGGTGTLAFLVGVGRFVNGEFSLAQFFLPDPAQESAQLEALTDFLAPCRALVTFNGKSFDAPLLKARYRLHSLPSPLEGMAHLDLLPLARRLWRDRLPSRTLKYLEEALLSAPRSSEEVPGYEVPWLYFDFLRTAQAEPLNGVFYHNAMDVVAMAALLNLAAQWLGDPHSQPIAHGLDIIALARLFEDLRLWEDAARLYERGLQTELPEEDFWQAVNRLSTLQKRRKNLPQALGLWQQAAQAGHLFALIELAKYEEHSAKNPVGALEYVTRAEQALTKAVLPTYQQQHWQDDLQRRRARLESRSRKA